MTTVGEAFVTMRPRFDGFARELEAGLSRILGSAALRYAGLAVGAGAVATATAKMAIDVESSFVGIRKTMDLTAGGYDEILRRNRELATEIPVSINEINRIGELGGQLGIRGIQNLVEFERTIASVAVATDLTSESAALAFAQIANVIQLPQDQIDNLAASIVGLGNSFATTESRITDFTLRIAGAGQIAGLTAGDITGIATAFASLGIPAEAGGTAVQKVLIQMDQAVATMNEDLQVFAATAGMSAQEFAALWEQDAGEAFVRFVNGLGVAGDDAVRVLEGLGLQDERLTRAFLSAAQSGDVLNRAVATGNSEFERATALQEEAAKFFGTTANQIQLMQNNFQDLAISVGNLLLPAIRRASEIAVDLTGVFDYLGERTALLETIIVALAMTLGTVLFGPAGAIAFGLAAMTQFELDWSSIWGDLPRPVQNAVLAIAEQIDRLTQFVAEATQEAAKPLNWWIDQLNKLPGVDPIGHVNPFAGGGSNLADQLRQDMLFADYFREQERQRVERQRYFAENNPYNQGGSSWMPPDVEGFFDFGGLGRGGGAGGAGVQQAKTAIEEIREAFEEFGARAERSMQEVTTELERYRDAAVEAGDETAVSLIDRLLEVNPTVQDVRSSIMALQAQYGDLAAEAAESARVLEEAAQAAADAWDKLHDQAVADADRMGRLLVNALRNRAQSELDATLDSLAEQRAARQRAYDQQLADLRRQTDRLLAPLQAELDAINDANLADQLRAIDDAIALAWDPRKRAELEQQRVELQRRMRQDEIRDEMAAIESRYSRQADALQASLDDELARLDAKEQRARDLYSETTAQWALEEEARKLILAGNLDVMTALIETHLDGWVGEWQSFGERVIDGPLADLREELRSIMTMMSSVGVGGGGTSKGGGTAATGRVSAMQAAIDWIAREKAEGSPAFVIDRLRKNFKDDFGIAAPLAEGGFFPRGRSGLGYFEGFQDEVASPVPVLDEVVRRAIREESGAGGGEVHVAARIFIGDREITDIVRVEVDEVARNAMGPDAFGWGVPGRRGG